MRETAQRDGGAPNADREDVNKWPLVSLVAALITIITGIAAVWSQAGWAAVLVTALIALAIAAVYSRRRYGRWVHGRDTWTVVVLSWTAALLLNVVFDPFAPSARLTIEEPAQDEDVGSPIFIRGLIEREADAELWVVLRPNNGGSYSASREPISVVRQEWGVSYNVPNDPQFRRGRLTIEAKLLTPVQSAALQQNIADAPSGADSPLRQNSSQLLSSPVAEAAVSVNLTVEEDMFTAPPVDGDGDTTSEMDPPDAFVGEWFTSDGENQVQFWTGQEESKQFLRGCRWAPLLIVATTSSSMTVRAPSESDACPRHEFTVDLDSGGGSLIAQYRFPTGAEFPQTLTFLRRAG